MSDKHTEPFSYLVIDPNNPCAIQMVDEDGMGWAFAYVHGLPIEGTHGSIDARRIVACWNACENIPTEALEAGVVAELVGALRQIAETNGGTPIERNTEMKRIARAAIAKAKGDGK